MKADQIKSINQFLIKNSSIAANRLVRIAKTKEKTNARYLNDNLVQLYLEFVRREKKKLSFSSFYKYCPNKYKKPHQYTDMCSYCEKNKALKYFIKNTMSIFSQLISFYSHHFSSIQIEIFVFFIIFIKIKWMGDTKSFSRKWMTNLKITLKIMWIFEDSNQSNLSLKTYS